MREGALGAGSKGASSVRTPRVSMFTVAWKVWPGSLERVWQMALVASSETISTARSTTSSGTVVHGYNRIAPATKRCARATLAGMPGNAVAPGSSRRPIQRLRAGGGAAAHLLAVVAAHRMGWLVGAEDVIEQVEVIDGHGVSGDTVARGIRAGGVVLVGDGLQSRVLLSSAQAAKSA